MSPDETLIQVDRRYFRPTEVEMLLGDRSKAEEKLDWQAEHSFEELAKDMIGKKFYKD